MHDLTPHSNDVFVNTSYPCREPTTIIPYNVALVYCHSSISIYLIVTEVTSIFISCKFKVFAFEVYIDVSI